MCPNIWSCSEEWFDELKNKEAKVVVVTWSKEGGPKNKAWVERLSELEKSGIPVHVCDDNTCGNIVKKLGAKSDGETIVFDHGVETGRLTPGDDFEGDLNKVKEMTK